MRASGQSVGTSRRKPREKGPSFGSAVATGAVLAAVVAGGVLLLNSTDGGGNQVTQLDTGRAGSDDELTEQIPVAEQARPSAVVPEPGGFVIPDSLTVPHFEIPDLTPSGGGVDDPAAPAGLRSEGSPRQPSTGAPPPAALTCPTFTAPATVAVNTVYPGGGAVNTVPVATGTLRATRAAFGPCKAQSVELAVSNGRATGPLGYGAWVVALEGGSPAAPWPVLVVEETKAVLATVEATGTCPTTKTKVAVMATNKPLLGLLGTPVLSGKVTAIPVATAAPCQPTAAVPVQLDLLGNGSVELAPGTWTFTVVGRSLVAPVSLTVPGEGRNVVLVAN